MYTGLLYTHSILRYAVLFLLLIVVIKSMAGWLGKKPFTKGDDKFSLFLLISTHLQLVVGLVLYYFSPFVQFNSNTMKVAETRYWSVEHIFMMLLAIVLITVARITHKKLADDNAKHKRLFILNAGALLIIIVAIVFSGRALLGSVIFN